MRHFWPGTSGLVVLLAFTACGDRPTEPDDPGPEIAETPRAPLLSTRVFDVEPGPGSPGCFSYTVTLSDDTVSAPSDDEDPPVVDIFVKLLDDDCSTSPIFDSVHVDFTPRILGPPPGPIGIPLVGQIPPEQIWFFEVRDNPTEVDVPWILGTFTDANGEIRVPYQTAGESGIDSLRLFPYFIDGPAGPGLDFEIVTSCDFFSEPVADPILSDPAVQDMLRDLWAESNPDDPAQWLEKGGYIVDRGNGLELVPFASNASPAMCGAGITGSEITAIQSTGGTIKGHFHTHPHTPGVPLPTSGVCKGMRSGFFGNGPSKADRFAANQAPWPSYVVDADEVHALLSFHPMGQQAVVYNRNFCPVS